MISIKSRKTNGNGYTYKVGGSWKTVIQVNGQLVSATNKSQQESKRLAKDRAKKAQLLNKGILVGAHRVKLSDHLIPWLETEHSYKIAHSTLVRYLSIAKLYIVPALGGIQLQKITKREIAQFMLSMAKNKVGPRTRNQALAVISVAMQGAVDAGLIDSNPALGVARAAESSRPITPLTEEQVIDLIEKSDATFMNARLHLAFCGMRQGEVLGLTWADVNLQHGSINLYQQVQKVKGKLVHVDLKSQSSNRTVMLSQSAIESLKNHKVLIARMRLGAGPKWKDKDLVFPNKKGSFIQSKWDYQRWQTALANSGISCHRLHDARHTAGTLLYANGEGIETIRRVLGHSNVSLTSRTYVHNAEKPLRAAANTMDMIYKKRRKGTAA